MYKNAYQHGLLTIFFSAGSNPLLIWGLHVKNGHIKTNIDPEIKSQVVDVMGLNVSTTYITCPKDLKQSLGIHLPFLVMIVKNLHKYFTFEITILDQSDCRRRFRVSNFQSTTTIHPFCTAMPIGLSGGWNQIQFNLAEFTRRAYKMQFAEVVRVQVNANARLRRIYFAERLYDENELPPEYKLYFPVKPSSMRKPLRPVPEINAAAEPIVTEKKVSRESLRAAPSASVKLVPSKASELVKDQSVSKASRTGLPTSVKGSLVTILDGEVPVKGVSEITDDRKSSKTTQKTENITVILSATSLQKTDQPVTGSTEGKKSLKSGQQVPSSDLIKSIATQTEDAEEIKEVLNKKEGSDINEAEEKGDGVVLIEEQRQASRSLDVIKEETASATKIE